MNGIREYQVELLKRFKFINEEFKKNDIFWFAHSGTLLGIIRHNGKMIPWDDDIDMAMPYDIFHKNRKKIEEICLKVNMRIRGVFEKTYFNIGKIISNDEIVITVNNKEYKTKLFIDIMFTIPEKLVGKNNSLRRVINSIPGRTIGIYLKHKHYSLLFRWILPISLMRKISKNKLNKARKYHSKKIVKYDQWMERMITYNIDDMIETKFENTNVFINKKYIDELNIWFNDWKNEKRIISHIEKGKQYLNY